MLRTGNDIARSGGVPRPFYVTGRAKGSFFFLSGHKIAGVITTQRPFQGFASLVAVGNYFLEDRQIDAGCEQRGSVNAVLLKIGLIFTLITFLIGELIAPLSEKMAQRMRIKATDSVVAQDFQSGLWIKDDKSFVNVATVLPDASLLNIQIYEFDDQFRLKRVRRAEKGVYQDKQWALTNVTQTVFLTDKKVENNSVVTEKFKYANWESPIRPELLNVLLVLPEKMSAWNLYSFINHLERNKQKTTRYDVALWSKLIYPLACLVMVMLALPFGFLQQRAGGTSAKIFVGLLLGVSYHILNRIFVHLGVLNDWPPLLSAVTPTIMFLLAAVGLIWTMERR